MILDHLKNSILYEGLSPRVSTALAHLASMDLKALAPGRYPIRGDEIVLLIQEVHLVPESEGTWESHLHHIDIQSPIRGSERMGRAATDALEMVSEHLDRDIRFHRGDGEFFTLSPGEFAVFFPSDAHMSCLDPGGVSIEKKAVMKILI
jgi:YhcH/YjgK/YiaL family protein